ncbi:MAG: potassium channel family protein [Acidimicrobiia bacterium]
MFRAVFKTLRLVWAEPGGRALILGAMVIVGTGNVFYMLVEGWSLVDALYFTVITLTTVGYGDLHPTTDISKIFAVAYVLAGVGFILAFLNFIVARTVKDRLAKREDS